MNNTTLRLLFLVFLFGITGCSLLDSNNSENRFLSKKNSDCLQGTWPHQLSDLPVDSALNFGRLDNGLRYVIMENHEPKDRVGIYLYVQSGSLHETEEQRGLAHFLEHMLFEGSTHFPPGTLVDYFQSIGMSFGADTNAHTGYDETVYNILLPSGSRKSLEDGLLVLADYAGGALLLDEEVEQEKGVILAEKRARDSAKYRLREKRFSFLFKGTKAAVRMPIGLEETIRKADHDLLNQYYTSWYRPENMIVVVVGDMKAGLAEELISQQFHALVSGKLGDCPDYGRVKHKGLDYFYYHEPELGATEVTIESAWNTDPEPDTLDFEKRKLEEYAAATIMDHRLQKLVNRPESPLTDAAVYSGIFLQRTGYAAVTADTDPTKWKQGLTLLSTSLRRALEYGFSENEVARVKKELLASLDEEVEKAATRDSRKLARQIIRKLSDNEVMLSPKREKLLFSPLVEEFTVASLNTAFRNLWSHDNRLVQVTGNVEIDKDDQAAVRKIAAVFEKSTKAEIKPPPITANAIFPYLSPPEQSGKIVSEEELSSFGAHRFTLENGIVFNFKTTDFKENEVAISVNFGNGRLGEPLPGLGMLAESVVRESGLGGLTKDQLAEALTGHDVKLYFKAGEESFAFTGHALQKDLEMLFQLLRTSLVDPAFRPEAYRRSMTRFGQMYDQINSSVEGVMALEGERFLAGNNPRYGKPAWKEFQKLTLEDVKDWLQPVFAKALLEITVVGDFEPTELKKLAALYLGSLQREPDSRLQGENIRFPAGKRKILPVKSVIDRAQVVVAWLTDDFWDISRTRRLHVLAAVLDDRLRKHIREKLGATYSPVVYNRSSRVDPGYGLMRAILIVDPKQTGVIVDEVHNVVSELVKNGITREELQRTVGPTLTSIKDSMRSNSYWLHSVLKLSSRHPEQLTWPLSIQQDFSSITAREISDFAKKYLGKDKAAVLVVSPDE